METSIKMAGCPSSSRRKVAPGPSPRSRGAKTGKNGLLDACAYCVSLRCKSHRAMGAETAQLRRATPNPR